jgi:hypothetical protein
VQAAAAAPGPPPNLTASVNGSTVTLTWLVPTSPDPATSYVLEAGSSPGSTNILVFDTLSTNTSFTATGVPAGTYYVRVRARNSAGTSSASNEVVVLVGGGGCTSAPGAPTGLASSVNGSSVTLTWTAPAGGCAPTAYVIEAGSASGASNLANFNTGSTATTFSAAGVGAGTYYVRVRSASSSGLSAASSEIIVTVGGGGPVNVTGRWIGVAPDGVIFNVPAASDTFCDDADDLQMDLTQSGPALTGTVTLRTRAARTPPSCSGSTVSGTATVSNGTVNGAAVSFVLGSGRMSLTFTGTISGTRMSGVTICGGDNSQCGTFAATRQ